MERPEFRIMIPYLDKDLNENSGLIWYRDKLWTINDSGGKSTLYSVTGKKGEIVQKIKLKDTKNRDWEDLSYEIARILWERFEKRISC